MDFKQATDRLMKAGLTTEDIAEGMGLAKQTVRAMRLDPSSDSYRVAPADWRRRLVALARGRGEELQGIARELSEEEGD